MSNKAKQNFSFPTTQHKLVYVKLYINKFHFVHPPSSKNEQSNSASGAASECAM